MHKFLFVVVLVALSAGSASAQVSGSNFVRVELNHPNPAFAVTWLNLRHMHSLQPCYARFRPEPDDDIVACIHMDGHVPGNYNRLFHSRKPYAQAVRDILSLPNPTWPSAVISGPVTATVGTPVTLTATVTDPDYGDSWTYAWIESSATMNGGTFGDATAAVTTYTPAMVGTVILWVLVLDDAAAVSVGVASGGRHRVGDGEVDEGAQTAARWTGRSGLAGPGRVRARGC